MTSHDTSAADSASDSGLDQLRASLPLDQIAAQVGADPTQVEHAIDAILPALFGGLAANAEDPAGEASLVSALGDHVGLMAGDQPVDLAQVNTDDGAKIARHIFGANEDQVVNQLGGLQGTSGDLVRKLIPILAPIVLAYLAKRMGSSAGAGGVAGGLVGQILQQILAGAAQGAGSGSRTNSRSGFDAGSIIGDILGGLLGAGRRK